LGELPTGTVTFLFTDLEGSTRLWERHADSMRGALARHDDLLRAAIEGAKGHVVKTTGDGIHAVFGTATEAVAAATQAQLHLAAERWGETGPLRVRMGLHTGSPEQRDGDYYGPTLNRAARIMAAAHGGQVLCSQVTADLVIDELVSEISAVDLGEHRLRDLGRPERLWQLSHSALSQTFPAIRTLDSFPSNLPSYLTSFVGRDAELDRITRQIQDNRLVTLTGTGGVGKTRLAVQVAARVLPTFSDGAWVCELAAAENAYAMEQSVATTLSVDQRGSPSLRAAIIDALKTKTALVVLDNCEHLLDSVAGFAGDVLIACPRVHILATSRELLGLEGEQAIGVRSLAVPRAEDVASLVDCSSVELFVDRAAAARDGFSLDALNTGPVREICRRLDGIPLAIELAAARVRAMSPADIAGRLDERFRLLTGGRRTEVERHQTLRNTVEWSYSMLDQSERRCFDRLGVFSASFDTAAAEAIVADHRLESWAVFDALTGLVDKSMVVAEEDADGAMRYQLLETMRQYARERLEAAAESDQWRLRHAAYYATLCEDIGPRIVGPDEIAQRLRLGLDLDNVRSAVTWALERADTHEHQFAFRIIAALAVLTGVDRRLGIGTWALGAVEAATQAAPALRGVVYATAAWSAYEINEHGACRELADNALADQASLSPVGTALLYASLGALTSTTGRFDEAVGTLVRGGRAVRGDGPEAEWSRATLETMSAIFASLGGDDTRARSLSDAGLRTARVLGSPSTTALGLFARGFVLRELDAGAALNALEEALELMRGGATNAVMSNTLLAIAQLHAEAGHRGPALRALRDGLEDGIATGGVSRTTPLVVECFFAIAETDPEAAAVLHGAVTAGRFGFVQAMILGRQQDVARQEKAVDALSVLSADHLHRARDDGASMTEDEVINFASAAIERALAASPHAS
jgi:predicted ATPase/class 3 adenylate cyclase